MELEFLYDFCNILKALVFGNLWYENEVFDWIYGVVKKKSCYSWGRGWVCKTPIDIELE